MQFIITRIFSAVVLAFGLTCSAGWAGEINKTDDNVAIQGYDPVAYFTQSKPVRGNPDFQSEWQDATWQFSSAEHKSMFDENPEKYAPRFGGFCAGAMSAKGEKGEIDPQYWMIVDGSLFLTGIPPKDYFNEDTDAKISKANANWEALN